LLVAVVVVMVLTATGLLVVVVQAVIKQVRWRYLLVHTRLR
jgi:hypothetical protein